MSAVVAMRVITMTTVVAMTTITRVYNYYKFRTVTMTTIVTSTKLTDNSCGLAPPQER